MLLVRVGIAKLKQAAGPPLIGLLPISICLGIWVLYETSRAFRPTHRSNLMLGILLTLVSIVSLYAAWW